MPEGHKRGFVLYFDNYACMAALPVEQRGLLISALFEYAMAAEDGAAKPGDILRRYPGLSPGGEMAFRFMADTIRRDTEKWLAKRQRYQDAARRRAEAPPEGGSLRKYVDELHERPL